MKLLKTTTANADFLKLEKQLDTELQGEYPNDMHNYSPYNKFVVPIKAVLVFDQSKAVACGAFKELDDGVEIKRMFVHPDYRGKGLSRKVLTSLEEWSQGLGFQYALLETGKKLFKPLGLYTSSGYEIIPNYGPYQGIETSICMKKTYF